MRVLVVEDEATLREGLIDLLQGAGYEASAAGDGRAALALGGTGGFDVVLLDLMLPKLDGLEVCRRLRRTQPDLHILMLTARGSEDDKVGGLSVGADDYLTKPFSPRELLARLEAVARRLRARPARPTVIRVGDLCLDLDRCQARRGERTIALTARETGILRWLHDNRERAVSRAELLERVWDAPGDLETRTVDMTISNLRQKIESDPSAPSIVVTVKGVGYAWGSR